MTMKELALAYKKLEEEGFFREDEENLRPSAIGVLLGLYDEEKNNQPK